MDAESLPENPAKTTIASTPAAAMAGAHRFSGVTWDDAPRGRGVEGRGVFTIFGTGGAQRRPWREIYQRGAAAHGRGRRHRVTLRHHATTFG
ncbi:MAG: hypothetical protein ACOYMR_00610 [Ilumatobacteraceae bacterium]